MGDFVVKNDVGSLVALKERREKRVAELEVELANYLASPYDPARSVSKFIAGKREIMNELRRAERDVEAVAQMLDQRKPKTGLEILLEQTTEQFKAEKCKKETVIRLPSPRQAAIATPVPSSPEPEESDEPPLPLARVENHPQYQAYQADLKREREPEPEPDMSPRKMARLQRELKNLEWNAQT